MNRVRDQLLKFMGSVGPWDLIYMDIPWPYYGDPCKDAACGKHYDSLPKKEIFALPLREMLKPTGLVLLWATWPKLDIAIKAMDHWQLYYRGCPFVWIKTRIDGTPIGAQGPRPTIIKPITECVLAASPAPRGRPLKLFTESEPQTVFAPRRRLPNGKIWHSAKPVAIREAIDRLFGPDVRKLELFARERSTGWDVWGNELG